MILEGLRTQVLETARLLPRFNLVWMAGGTVCARDPKTNYVVVTPSGMPYDTLTPADLNVSDVNNNPIEGKYRPSVALGLWTAIFRARPDVNAIVHTHSPYATAFSTTYEPVPILTETMADWFNAPIPVAPYRHVEAPDFFDLPAQVLGDGFAVLLGQHGPITVGKNLAHALERAVTLEEGALTCMIARTIGHPQALTAEQVRRSFEYYHHRYGQPGQGGVTEEDIDQV